MTELYDPFARWKPDGFADYLTVQELATLVGRTKDRILQLEKEGVLAAPIRVKVGRTRVRLYSPAEARTIAEHFKNARPGPRSSTKEEANA